LDYTRDRAGQAEAWYSVSGPADAAVLVGKLSVFPAEVEPTLKSLLAAGLVPSSLHNATVPTDAVSAQMLSLHFEGRGPAAQLSAAAAAVFSSFKDLKSADATPPAAWNVAPIREIFGRGTLASSGYRVSTDRGMGAFA
jgi:hypothetical protein